MSEEEIQRYAESLGYNGAEKTKSKFGEYEIYLLNLGKPLSCVGYPRALLVKDDEVRVSELDELTEYFSQYD